MAKATTPNATDEAVELAKSNSLSLSDIKGTGADGRVLKADVEAAVSKAEARRSKADAKAKGESTDEPAPEANAPTATDATGAEVSTTAAAPPADANDPLALSRDTGRPAGPVDGKGQAVAAGNPKRADVEALREDLEGDELDEALEALRQNVRVGVSVVEGKGVRTPYAFTHDGGVRQLARRTPTFLTLDEIESLARSIRAGAHDPAAFLVADPEDPSNLRALSSDDVDDMLDDDGEDD